MLPQRFPNDLKGTMQTSKRLKALADPARFELTTSAFGGQSFAAIDWATSMVGQGDLFAALPTPERAKPTAAPAEQGPAERRSMRRSGNGTVDKQTKINRSVAFNLGHKEQGGRRGCCRIRRSVSALESLGRPLSAAPTQDADANHSPVRKHDVGRRLISLCV